MTGFLSEPGVSAGERPVSRAATADRDRVYLPDEPGLLVLPGIRLTARA